MYQLVYDKQVTPHPTKPPDLHPHPKPNKPVDPQLSTSQQLQVHATHTKTASAVPPEDGRLMPETYRGFRHNKAIGKVKVKLVTLL
jgi:hypothetical protein